MPRPSANRTVRLRAAAAIVETPQTTLLELFDELLNKGVMANGDVMLGLAGIDLIYLRLSTLLCAADRVLPDAITSIPRSPKRSLQRRRRTGETHQSGGRRTRKTSRSKRQRKS